MGKRKTLQPLQKPKKQEGNPKALKITAIAFGTLLIALIAIVVLINN
ncbi:hypothetical protein MO973_26750 [Paenibacillus sp. TRM 82003]|nr:hypothetical protein [Paenibacillus sp. TRM 82003]